MSEAVSPDSPRRSMYGLLITVAVAAACGRILSAELLYEPSLHRKNDQEYGRKWPDSRPFPMPTFSSNDRSRWCTIRALVDEGTYVIGYRDPALKSDKNKYGDVGITFEDGWGTVDKVLKPGTGEFYSSKPPLFSTIVAGEYWLLKHLLGWSFATHRWEIVRVILFTFNLLPWLIYLLLLVQMLERFGTTDWGRLFTLSAAAFGTMMTPFVITLNNHTLATCTALATVYVIWRIWENETGANWRHYLLAGLLAGFTVANELPAAAFAAGAGLLLFFHSSKQTMLSYVPGVLIPVAALLFTNWLALGQLRPAYSEFGSDWYRYEGSHWAKTPDPNKPGIDFARLKETQQEYAFHVLIGHHGWFSLMPIFLLSLVGMWRALRRRAVSPFAARNEDRLAFLWGWFALFTLALSLIVIGFYLVKSDNYGGWTCGPRWLMWLTPFWLLTLLPIADRLGQSRGGRCLGYLLLGLSVLSMSYAAWNPWRHPWIYNWMDAQGWIPY